MKIISLILIVIVFLTGCSKKEPAYIPSPDSQRFLGKYYLEETCNFFDNDSVFNNSSWVEIRLGVKSDLLIDKVEIKDIKAFVSVDSLFFQHWWKNYDGTTASIRGKGIIKVDSLFLFYTASGTFGEINCECKGEK